MARAAIANAAGPAPALMILSIADEIDGQLENNSA
jgi:hypothetical protein